MVANSQRLRVIRRISRPAPRSARHGRDLVISFVGLRGCRWPVDRIHDVELDDKRIGLLVLQHAQNSALPAFRLPSVSHVPDSKLLIAG